MEYLAKIIPEKDSLKLVKNEAIVITKITAPPIPEAVSTFFDTPRNGHIPKNWLSTTLFTMADPIAIINNSFIYVLLLFFISRWEHFTAASAA